MIEAEKPLQCYQNILLSGSAKVAQSREFFYGERFSAPRGVDVQLGQAVAQGGFFDQS